MALTGMDAVMAVRVKERLALQMTPPGPIGSLRSRQGLKMAHRLRAGRGAFFELQWVNGPILDNQQVNCLVPLKVKWGLATVMPPAFQQFRHHPGFQDRTGGRPGLQGLRAGPFGKPGTQADIQEVQLGGFDQPLGEVAMIRLQEVDDPRCLEDGVLLLAVLGATSTTRANSARLSSCPERTAEVRDKRSPRTLGQRPSDLPTNLTF